MKADMNFSVKFYEKPLSKNRVFHKNLVCENGEF